MKRFILLLRSEFRFFLTAPVVHLIAIIQPTLMYILMSVIMVVPTFEMRIADPPTQLGKDFLAAAEQVGSPIGPDYIEPVLVEDASPGHRQVIEVLEINGVPTAQQRYGYIDSNLVKNLRNRLTAALLVLWNSELGDQAILIQEHPWLPQDIPYTVYFGMAMIPLAAYLAAAMIGGYLMAQEFENGTILSYKLCPTPFRLILAARITRLVVTSLLAAIILYITLGLITGVWSSSLLAILAILLPLILIASCIGLIAGMVTRSSFPPRVTARSTIPIDMIETQSTISGRG